MLPAVEGADIRFARGDVRRIHDEMKTAAAGKNIWVVGGGNLTGQFHDARPLDEFIIQIGSAILGSGKPLFHRRAYPPAQRLHTVRQMDEGMVELRYEVTTARETRVNEET